MKKVLWIPIILILWLFILFVPIPHGSYDDGGTREYISLTYRLVDWNRITPEGTYQKTKLYFGADRNKPIDELFQREYQPPTYTMVATILQINGDSVLVEPVEESFGADKISFSKQEMDNIGATVGSVVEITFNGEIMESYPAQIKAISWKMATNLRHLEYTEPWLNKETAEKYDYNIFDHIVITKIYANCFFARTVIPMPYEIKLNGTLSEDWCVGDQVTATYTNIYYDGENNRVEVDFTGVEASDWQPDPEMNYKPVIYLYPEEEREVSVYLTLSGRLTCTYPAYENGWTVTAAPDGTLTDGKGQTYNYLYWEGETDTQYDLSQGFCVKGEDTAAFLEDTLAKLGLTRREANEFIVYWLPLMEKNPYNIIAFQTDIYTENAKLAVEPTPDTLIRVFMAWQAADQYVQLQEQELSAPERTGFTVVEWGGTEVNNKGLSH